MVLYRIDDRLVHGQVIVGWIRNLDLKWLYVVDDEIDENQAMIMKLTVPPEIEFEIFSVEEVSGRLSPGSIPESSGMILVKSPKEIMRIIESGILIEKVHIGGLHYRPERDQYCEYVFLSPDEVEEIREIIRHDTIVTVQSLPTLREIPIEKLIQK